MHTIASRELASLTLGDAGGAVLVQRAENGEAGITFAGFTTISEHSRLCLAYPARHDPGALMFTKSRALQEAAIADALAVLREVLDSTSLEIEDIDWVIPHQTSAKAIRKGMAAFGEALGGDPREPAVVTVDRYGNTASTTHMVALSSSCVPVALRSGIALRCWPWRRASNSVSSCSPLTRLSLLRCVHWGRTGPRTASDRPVRLG